MWLKRLKNMAGKARAGFTMAEVLIVVAIIAILAGVAIPSIIAIQRNLEMTRLDESAKTIYVAAQNRMSEMHVSGQIEGLNGTKIDEETVLDFDATGLDWAKGDYRYISSDSAAINSFFDVGAIDSSFYSGKFYIEYNSKTGMVYGVFYSDSSFPYSTEGNPLPRDRGARRAHSPRLGYYGGADIAGVEVGELEGIQFEIVNDEVLRAVITVDPVEINNKKYTLRITDTQGGIEQLELDSGVFVPNIEYSNGTFTVILDSHDSSKFDLRFATLFPKLLPGSDLTVTLTVEEENKLPGVVSKTTNSLFAKVNNPVVGSESVKTAFITNARHLQNLNTGGGGVFGSGVDYDKTGIVAAELGAGIDWKVYKQRETFSSINNSDAAIKSFKGNGNTITNLNAALFDTFGREGTKSAISDLRLIDSKITKNGGNAGVLANTTIDAAIEKCFVYATGGGSKIDEKTATLSSSGASNTGGLIGQMTRGSITGCWTSLTGITATGGNVGGLVGGLVGGPAGDDSKTIISESYADTGYWSMPLGDSEAGWAPNSGIVVTGSGYAGGFVGSASGVCSIINCYAAGNIRLAGGVAGGFAANSVNGVSASNSYSVTTFDGSADAVKPNGFSNAATTNGTCFYLENSGVTGNKNGERTFEEMTKLFSNNEKWTASTESTTAAYGRKPEKDEKLVYPFPRLAGKTHHGDWPDEMSAVGEGLYYYEKYLDGATSSYGLYAEFPGEEVELVNTLRDDLTVLEDGYAFILISSDPTDIEFRDYVNGDNFSACAASDFTTQWELDEERTAYLMSDLLDVRARMYEQSAYYSFKLNGAEYYVNPDFAKTVLTVSAGAELPAGNGATPRTYEVRTARHIAMLGAKNRSATPYNHYSGSTFNQTRNIDFSTYGIEGNRQVSTPIGGGSGTNSYFSGIFDGRGYSITITEITGSDNVGLFGRMNGGSLKNVNLMGAAGAKITSTGNNTGGLVGLAESGANITNCFVSGITISGAVNVGGFVGRTTDATITNCAAANGYFSSNNGGSINRTSASAVTGGFVGANNGGTIQYCYAVARFGFTTTENSNGFFGTNTSTIRSSYCFAQNAGNGFVYFGTGGTLTDCLSYNGMNKKAILSRYSASPWGMVDVAHSFPYDLALAGEAYPLPAVVTENNAIVHYGNWPKILEVPNDYIHAALYQRYEGTFNAGKYEGDNGVFGLYYEDLGIDGIQTNRTPLESGYMILVNVAFYKDLTTIDKVETTFDVYLVDAAGNETPFRIFQWKGARYYVNGTTYVDASGNAGTFTYGGTPYVPIFISSATTVGYVGIRVTPNAQPNTILYAYYWGTVNATP